MVAAPLHFSTFVDLVIWRSRRLLTQILTAQFKFVHRHRSCGCLQFGVLYTLFGVMDYLNLADHVVY
jgi:hypothetical protein